MIQLLWLDHSLIANEDPIYQLKINLRAITQNLIKRIRQKKRKKKSTENHKQLLAGHNPPGFIVKSTKDKTSKEQCTA